MPNFLNSRVEFLSKLDDDDCQFNYTNACNCNSRGGKVNSNPIIRMWILTICIFIRELQVKEEIAEFLLLMLVLPCIQEILRYLSNITQQRYKTHMQ